MKYILLVAGALIVGYGACLAVDWFGFPVHQTITTNFVTNSTVTLLTEQQKCKTAGGTFMDTGINYISLWYQTNPTYEISCKLPSPAPLFDYKITQ